MADGGVIKEFLVGLGWKIDKSSQRGFESALEDSKKAALALTAALTGVVAAVAKVAQSYEQLEYASQRAQSSVTGMQKFAFAISEMGGNADAARSSLQAMGNFLRSTPGGEGFIQRLGVQTRDANGAMRDTSDIMADIGKQVRSMPYWRARNTTAFMGIDENTLQAMIRGTGDFGNEYSDIYKRVGVNQDQAARSSAKFMQQLRLLGVVFSALRDKVAVSLMRGIGGDMTRFRNIIVDHADQISKAIETIARFVTILSASLMQLFSRGSDILSGLFGWFTHLDKSTKEWIGTLGLLLAAWKLLNSGFLATPIGRILALGTAFLSIYDDFKVWQSGGKSLIPWEEWKPEIDYAIAGIKQLKDWLINLDGGTKTFIATLGGLLLAWRLFNAGFAATPVGVILTLGAAILGLYNDYKTWESGSKSFIDWSKWKPGIDAAIDAIHQVKTLLADLWPDVEPTANAMLNFFKHAFMDSLKSTGQAIGWIARAIDDLLHHNFRGVWNDIKGAASQGWDNVKDLGQAAAGVGSALGRDAAGIGSAIAGGLVGMDAGRVNDAMKYLTSQGIDRDHALAMIGNWQQESNIGSKLGDGSHRGLEQWEPSRQRAILENTGIDVKTAGLPDQMRAALWELRNGPEASHFQQFMRTTGVNEAAGYFAQNIERSGEKPGDRGFDARIAYAHSAATVSNLGGLAGNQAPTVNQTVTINGATNPQAVADSVVRVTHSAVNTAYRNFVPRRQ